MNKVLVYRTLPSEQLNVLKEQFEIKYFPNIEEPLLNDKFLHALNKADALFGAGLKVTEELLNKAPNLKIISNFSAGYDNLNLEMLSKRNIIATNAPDALVDTVADLIFSLILSTSRRVVELDKFIRKGDWKKNIEESSFGIDVHHKTIGILGLGRIGKKVAQRALGFDMNIMYHKRTRDKEAEKTYRATYVDKLDELLAESDFICVTLPLNKETKHLINYEKLELMKPDSIIINASRGAVINESDLIKALENKVIGGAGLDVYEQEPIERTNKLINLNNVVLTPHIGSATAKTREMMIEQGINNLTAALDGKEPDNLLN